LIFVIVIHCGREIKLPSLTMSAAQQKAFVAQVFQMPPDVKMIEDLCSAVGQLIQLSPPNRNSLMLPNLPYFIARITSDSQVGSAVIYVAMYYIQKLRGRLSPNSIGMACTAHRIALAAIILAEKYICDIALKNSSWAVHAKYLPLNEINLMERQFLFLLVYHIDVGLSR
jgi:hypothetical protein